MPYRERLALIVNELGTGLAGRRRGPERGDPARQPGAPGDQRRARDPRPRPRARSAGWSTQSDTVIAELARRRGEVTSFIDRADRVAREVAGRRGDLGEAIERLPPLLDELEPTADRPGGARARRARRRCATCARAAPGAQRCSPTSTRSPTPRGPRSCGWREMSRSAAAPCARRARWPRSCSRSRDACRRSSSSRADAATSRCASSGVVEGLQVFTYYAPLATSRFDRFSHILPSYQVAALQQYATTPVAAATRTSRARDPARPSRRQPKARDGDRRDRSADRRRRSRTVRSDGDRRPQLRRAALRPDLGSAHDRRRPPRLPPRP